MGAALCFLCKAALAGCLWEEHEVCASLVFWGQTGQTGKLKT